MPSNENGPMRVSVTTSCRLRQTLDTRAGPDSNEKSPKSSLIQRSPASSRLFEGREGSQTGPNQMSAECGTRSAELWDGRVVVFAQSNPVKPKIGPEPQILGMAPMGIQSLQTLTPFAKANSGNHNNATI